MRLLNTDINDYIDALIKEKIDKMIDDEPVEKDTVGVVDLTDLLKQCALIKQYNLEKVSPDERIHLCADHIEQELSKLRYAGFILDTDW